MAITADNTTDTINAPVATAPPRRVVRRRQRSDHNRSYEILSVLLLYIIAVHYALKFASFFLPEDTPSREAMLGVRGASGVLGFSFKALPRRKPSFHNIHEQRRIASSCRSHSIIKLHSLSDPMQDDDPIEIANEKVANIPTKVNNNNKNNNVRKSNRQRPEKSTNHSHKRLRIPILSYQSSYVIVSKPTSMTMHHNSNTRWGRSKSPVLQTTIHKQLSRKPYLVHRLDHRTSGACIVGFDSGTARELHGRLRGSGAVKLYVALVRGDLREQFRHAATSGSEVDMSVVGDGSIIGSHDSVPDIMTTVGEEQDDQSPHCRDRNSASSEYSGKITVNMPIKVNVNDTVIEKEAQTDFYFLSSMPYLDDDDDDENTTLSNSNSNVAKTTKTRYINKELTLLLCHPQTGRTHQIRKHVAKAFNSPIIGDSEHGDSRVNRYWRETVGLDRLGLHCWYLGLPPVSSVHNDNEDDIDDNGSIECMAPLATDFTEALQHERLSSLWEEATRVEPRLKMEPYDDRGGTFGRNYQQSLQRDGEDGNGNL
eukprot:CAMPEP_0172304744 /NCGR_PEP_ID=MMETSP1058-20130122/6132_1 /TAXON_ID=83371 /ORGANISM="Detonula confervacea, Strain CCMP 353" /LENGTH=538 /DNA_ID=CAMNT_0013016109 /DNA_START=136 /DNA_END=1752 /DNA_ORIENTATION=-